MLIGETSTFEKTTDRTYHTGDGSKTEFGIQFSGDNVQIFKEGILQRNGTDITIDPGGMFVTFGTAPASGDKIDCLGFLEITNTGRNSVKRIEHLASAGQTQFTIPNFEVLDTLFVTLNGVVLYSTDFTQDITQGWIVLASPAVQDDVVTIMHFKPTFRIGSSGSSAAAASAVLAETSATNAAASLDSFDDRYLGAKSSVPTLDNDGDALLDGTLYFDTTGNNMRVYDLGATTWSVLDTLPQGLAATDSPEFLAVKTADIKSKTGVASLAITDAGKIKLPVASGIYKGASDTAVLTESSGVVTLDNVTLGSSAVFPAGHVLQVKHTTYTDSPTIVAAATNTFVDWSTVIKATITNVAASSHILITVMYSPAAGDGEAILSAVFASSDGTDSGTFTVVGGTGDVAGSQLATHDGFFLGATTARKLYDLDRDRRSIQIIDTSPRTGTNQYRFRTTTAGYTQTIYLGRSLSGSTSAYDSVNPTTFNLMEIAQ